MGRRPEQKLFPRRHTNVQQVHKTVLNITDHQRNANQNHSEIMPLPFRMAVIKETGKCWRGCEEKGTLMHCWRVRKLVQQFEKQYGVSSKR